MNVDEIATLLPTIGRRLWRIVIITVVAIALLFVLRLIWGEIAARRLKEAVAEIRAGGDPTTVEELYPANDPHPSDNAVPIIQQAMAAMNRSVFSPGNSNSTFPAYPPYPPQWQQLMDAATKANAQTFVLMRKARRLHHFYWPPPPKSTPFFAMRLMGTLNSARSLGTLFADAAEDAAQRGDGVSAMEHASEVIQIGNAIDAQSTLISHLVGIGLYDLAINTICRIAPDLNIPPRNEANPLRMSIRAFIARFIDDDANRFSMRRALRGELVEQISVVEWRDRQLWAIRPMDELDLARMLRLDEQLLSATGESCWPAARAAMRDFPVPSVSVSTTWPPTQRKPSRFSHILSFEMMASADRWTQSDYANRVLAHMAAISLAAQLYRADHGGRWPMSLSELVPNYLPKIPDDSFAPASTPMGYVLVKKALPDGRDRPLLHSVGRNSVDDRPNGQAAPPLPVYGWSGFNIRLDDQFCDLSRWSPTPAKK